MVQLVQHHVKYKEIHGEDVIIIMTMSEHKKLHNKLRRIGKCNVPADELRRISDRANHRTPWGKARSAKYNHKIKRLQFRERIGKYIQLIETISLNPTTEHVCVSCCFQATNYKHLYYIDI